MMPVRNITHDTCPSPVARKLRMNRTAPSGRFHWFRCVTIDGLNSAAEAMEYSIVK